MKSKNFKHAIHNCDQSHIFQRFLQYSTIQEGLALKQISIFLFITMLLGFVIPESGTSAPRLASDSSSVTQLIIEGDNFSEKTFDNQKALERFIAASKVAPNNYEILWRLSRTYVDIGEHLSNKTDAEKKIQLEHYEKSLEYANQAVQVNPTGAMGFIRRAIASGRIALFRGIWESLSLVKQVKADCEKAISLDVTAPAAYYLLGRTNAKVCEKPKIVRWPLGLGWASMDDAIINYEKSIELRPGFIMYRLDCARAYIDEGEYAKAREHLNKISSLAKEDEDDDNFRKEAADLLETIKGK
jgi:FimV-like protein